VPAGFTLQERPPGGADAMSPAALAEDNSREKLQLSPLSHSQQTLQTSSQASIHPNFITKHTKPPKWSRLVRLLPFTAQACPVAGRWGSGCAGLSTLCPRATFSGPQDAVNGSIGCHWSCLRTLLSTRLRGSLLVPGAVAPISSALPTHPDGSFTPYHSGGGSNRDRSMSSFAYGEW
jgi:hypothetical protein